MRKVFQILCDRKYDILMVAADAGQSFGDLTTEYLGRLHKEHGTMIAVCTKHYGEITASAYSSHKDMIPYTLHVLGCFNKHQSFGGETVVASVASATQSQCKKS